MCYMSDAAIRKKLHGTFSVADIEAIAKATFSYMIKLQIGCGAEPTIYKHLPYVVKLAHDYGIPYISLTTNGMLLNREKIEELVNNGLNELTLSVHGLTKYTYEGMMQGARFDRFLELAKILSKINTEQHRLKIRINYTVNEDNIEDLRLLPKLQKTLHIDILQIRPIQKIGNTTYDNFSKEKITRLYDECIKLTIEKMKATGTQCLYPSCEDLRTLGGTQGIDGDKKNSVIDTIPYFYLAPYNDWKDKINPYEESFYDYCRRNRRVEYMIKNILHLKVEKRDDLTKGMNYVIK